jgi:hypothetical protein
VTREQALGAAVAALLQAYGIAVAPERAARLAAGLVFLLDKSARDEVDEAPDFAAVMDMERWRA